MLKKCAVRPLVVQMVAVATTALRTAKHHVVATDAVAVTALTSVANKLAIILIWLKLRYQLSSIPNTQNTNAGLSCNRAISSFPSEEQTDFEFS
tara:strand:+ start:165 stop:446 length:282 start_codon:yes stop_codon:yes gene_type:complete